MKKRDIVVIGGSVGSLSVLKKLVGNLPPDFPAAVFVVWHLAPNSPGTLPEVLDRSGTLPAMNAAADERFESGRVYVAPPDYHLTIEDRRVRLGRGPKENRFRPAVDPLFRSAAQWHGSRVVGVILSGGLDDGTSGLWAIKEAGGTTIVQDPDDAEAPSMPASALEKVKVDYCVPGAGIAELLIRLVNEEAKEVKPEVEEKNKTEIESAIAAGKGAMQEGVLEIGSPSLFACPDCHGVLMQITEGRNIRFRCHTGHAFSSGTLYASIAESVEGSLWNAVRALEESYMLMDHLSAHLKESDPELANLYREKARELEKRSVRARELTMENGATAEPDSV